MIISHMLIIKSMLLFFLHLAGAVFEFKTAPQTIKMLPRRCALAKFNFLRLELRFKNILLNRHIYMRAREIILDAGGPRGNLYYCS